MESNLLVEAIRGEIQEKRFYGWVIVVNKNHKILRSLEIPDYTCFMRSCAKPIQELIALESGVIDKYNFNLADIAIGYSSHVGSRDHINQIKSILDKLNLQDSDLLCGSHVPIDDEERERLIKEDLPALSSHNNCSGKHSLALAACKTNNWDIKNYTNLEHPYQKRVLELLKYYCKPNKVYTGIDGCSMPVHGMLLSYMGAGFAKLFSGSTPDAEIIADAITQYPVLAGGKGRIDTAVIQASEGKLLGKIGAEGLFIVTPRGSGEALVVKASDGNNYMRDFVVIEALRQLKWIDEDVNSNPYLTPFTKLDIINCKNDKVGYYKFRFKL